MWFSNRDNEEINNLFLKKLEDKKYKNLSIKMNNIFELFFEKNDLYIVECCDGYFCEKISVSDLLELSKYFLEVAQYYKTLENHKK